MARVLPRLGRLRRLVGGAAFFLLGGTTAAALSVARQPQHDTAAARPVPIRAVVGNDRVEISAASLRQAYADGLIDRPIRTVLNVPGSMRYGDSRWDERGVPAGPIWVRVDLDSQLISVFRAGHEIGTAVILHGADGLPTPTGKFPILAKLKHHRSATYDAPMPYTLRLTADGVAIHASDVRRGYATHGCVGVPADFAARLFAAASVGDEVLVVGGANTSRG